MTCLSIVTSRLHDISKHHDDSELLSLQYLFQIAQVQDCSIYKSTEEQLYVEAIRTLLLSPTASALLFSLSTQDIALKFSEIGEYASAFDWNKKIIHINHEFLNFTDKEVQASLLVYYLSHHARRAWQYSENFGGYIARSVTEFTQKFRDEEADASAVQIQIAHELKAMGKTSLWYLILDSFALDSAISYGEIRDKNLDQDAENKALRLAYAKWFEDFDYIAECDDRALIAQGLEGDESISKMRVF
ncbi:MAG: hypothetical protein CMP22_01170 [Rickettsiales bacterium]|nr:hypothetical protein [Rickettsiales bacterium]